MNKAEREKSFRWLIKILYVRHPRKLKHLKKAYNLTDQEIDYVKEHLPSKEKIDEQLEILGKRLGLW